MAESSPGAAPESSRSGSARATPATSLPTTSLPTTSTASDLDDDVDVEALLESEQSITNLSDLISRNARRRPDATALVRPGPDRLAVTWAEVDAEVSSLAAGLAQHGVLAGHRLAMRAPTSVPYVLVYLAALRAGIVAVPMGVRAGSELSARWLVECGARMLLTTSEEELDGGIETIPLTAEGLAGLSQHGRPVVSPPDRETLAVVLYTAGTAEEPHPVMLSHRALLAGLDSTGPGQPTPDAVIGLALPLSGAFGLAVVLGSWATVGCRLVVTDERADLAELAQAEAITHLPVTPPMLFRMLQRATSAGSDLRTQLATVTSVVSAGARPPWPMTREFTERTGLRVEQAYGLTETGLGVSSTLGAELLGPGHVGRALPGVEIRIGDGTEDEPGEIWVRGDMLFSGYWPDGAGGPGPDGWWNTGDLGYLRGQDLFILDRSRDLLTVSGFTVYPAEVEQVVAEFDGVDAVAVIGVPDTRAGQRMVAFVAGSATPEEVLEHCRGRLAPYKRPREVRRVDRLPRTITGVVRRGALRAMLAEEAAGRDGADE